MSDITLTIKTLQEWPDQPAQTIEFVSEGKYYQKNGSAYIAYRETELSGLAGHKTVLMIKPDSVIMRRYGAAPLNLNFQLGQRATTEYKTPYGVFQLDYCTEQIRCQLTAAQGEIRVVYQLSLNRQAAAQHTLDISYHAISTDE